MVYNVQFLHKIHYRPADWISKFMTIIDQSIVSVIACSLSNGPDRPYVNIKNELSTSSYIDCSTLTTHRAV